MPGPDKPAKEMTREERRELQVRSSPDPIQ